MLVKNVTVTCEPVMKRTLLLSFVVFISACATNTEGWGPNSYATKIVGADGSEQWAISGCTQAAFCLERASKICAGPFQIIEQSESLPTANAAYVQGVFVAGSNQENTIKIKCP